MALALFVLIAIALVVALQYLVRQDAAAKRGMSRATSRRLERMKQEV